MMNLPYDKEGVMLSDIASIRAKLERVRKTIEEKESTDFFFAISHSTLEELLKELESMAHYLRGTEKKDNK